jgi:hypothetical protein
LNVALWVVGAGFKPHAGRILSGGAPRCGGSLCFSDNMPNWQAFQQPSARRERLPTMGPVGGRSFGLAASGDGCYQPHNPSIRNSFATEVP